MREVFLGSVSVNSPQILRLSDVVQKTRLAKSSIFRLMSLGLFPKNFKLVEGGSASGWLESDIDAYIINRASVEVLR